jgi:hypothetical protein
MRMSWLISAAAVFLMVTPAFADLVQWTIVNAQFNDGGALTGSFLYDTTTGSVTNYSIDAGAGPDPFLGEFLYTPSDSTLSASIGLNEAFLDFCRGSMPISGAGSFNRCLHLDIIIPFFPPFIMTSLSDLSAGILPLALATATGPSGASGSFETGPQTPLTLFEPGVGYITVDLPTCLASAQLPFENRCVDSTGGAELGIVPSAFTSPIPEPQSMLLLATVFAGLILKTPKSWTSSLH